MSARYGSRTRSGEAVSDLGRRAEAGAGGAVKQPYEQVFTAPGTWTWPGNVSYVKVTLVGGGGGSSYSPGPAPTTTHGGGGGGGVRIEESLPVSAPVSITVGAGGSGGVSGPTPAATAGGSSSFGPISVDGGAYSGAAAPATGGGGGGGPALPNSASTGRGLGGAYGSPGHTGQYMFEDAPTPRSHYAAGGGGGAGGSAVGVVQVPTDGPENRGIVDHQHIGRGVNGYGGGGGCPASTQLTSGTTIALYTVYTDGVTSTDGRANTGAGGSAGKTGYDGGSGIVIVEWFE